MKTFFTNLISNGDGNPSLMRVASLLVVVDTMAVWTYKCITATEWVPVDQSTAILVVGVLGAKAIQKHNEKG